MENHLPTPAKAGATKKNKGGTGFSLCGFLIFSQLPGNSITHFHNLKLVIELAVTPLFLAAQVGEGLLDFFLGFGRGNN